MWGIIADRRVSKIHEILSTLQPETAAQIAKGNFDSEFKVFQEAWEAKSLVPMQRNHGIESHLFLCSEFCSARTFADISNKWNAWYEKHKGDMDFQFETRAAPDELLLASLRMQMLMKKNNFDLEAANEWLDASIPAGLTIRGERPRLTTKWLMSSDSTPNRPEAMKEIPLFESHVQFMKRGSMQFLLNVLEAELAP